MRKASPPPWPNTSTRAQLVCFGIWGGPSPLLTRALLEVDVEATCQSDPDFFFLLLFFFFCYRVLWGALEQKGLSFGAHNLPVYFYLAVRGFLLTQQKMRRFSVEVIVRPAARKGNRSFKLSESPGIATDAFARGVRNIYV